MRRVDLLEIAQYARLLSKNATCRSHQGVLMVGPRYEKPIKSDSLVVTVLTRERRQQEESASLLHATRSSMWHAEDIRREVAMQLSTAAEGSPLNQDLVLDDRPKTRSAGQSHSLMRLCETGGYCKPKRPIWYSAATLVSRPRLEVRLSQTF